MEDSLIILAESVPLLVVIIIFSIIGKNKKIKKEEETRKKEIQEENARKEKERQKEIQNFNENLRKHQNNLNVQMKLIKQLESDVIQSTRYFFCVRANNPKIYNFDIENIIMRSGNKWSFMSYESYNSFHESLFKVIEEMKKALKKMEREVSSMQETNRKLMKIANTENRFVATELEKANKIYEEALQLILNVEHIAESLIAFKINMYISPPGRMMDEKRYGKINEKYWDYICNQNRNIATDLIRRTRNFLDEAQVDEICKINIDSVLACVWIFAIEKIVTSDFQAAINVFRTIYKEHYADIFIAELYAKKKVGGEASLRESIQNILKLNLSSEILTLIASSMMWMNAYQCEQMVLQHMLVTGKEMSGKVQERLHSLTNGGGKAPNGFEIESSDNIIYFDVSALAWRDDEYIGLFENLAFQDRVLTYSLAVREENKELFVSKGINIPDEKNILNKLKMVFEEEYGSDIKVDTVNGIVLSGSGEEKMKGVLVVSEECKQMGILMHIAKIGKKLIIKFYTLFMPIDVTLMVQKQQVLSLYKKLSPLVTMWESSLKDTMLVAVEQILNTTAFGVEENSISEIRNKDATEPLF